MKKFNFITTIILAILVLILVICLICSSDNSKKEDNYQETIVESNLVIDIQKDTYGNIIQKTVYNTTTGYSYIYMFEYTLSGHPYQVSKSSLLVIDNEGNIITNKKD